MKKAKTPVPKGFHTITPNLVIKGAAKAIEFYKKAFGAVEHNRMLCEETGLVMHAHLTLGTSQLFVSDEMMGCSKSPLALKGTPVSLFLYVDDVDKFFKRAVAAGAKVEMPVQEMFWGDRMGNLEDPFGHSWGVGTHTYDVTPAEMAEGQEAFMAQFAKPAKKSASAKRAVVATKAKRAAGAAKKPAAKKYRAA